MADRTQYDENDPRHHTTKLKGMLTDVVRARPRGRGQDRRAEGPGTVRDHRGGCAGLERAFEHDEGQSEQAWQR